MENVTIGFSKPKDRLFPIGSWLIRSFQRTSYSHVYLKFHSESLNRVLIYEAVSHGVRFVGSKVWETHAVEIKSYTVSIKKCNQITLLQYCIDNAGVDYGTKQNIGIFLASVFNLKENPFKKGKNCSEVIGEVLRLEGYKIEKDANLLTPLDIDNILAN